VRFVFMLWRTIDEPIWFIQTIHGSILPEEPGPGSGIKIGSRLIRIGFWSRSWSRLQF